MGGKLAMLSGTGVAGINLVEDQVREKRNNLLIAVTICIIIFIAISYNYMSATWLWLIIPIFIITGGLLGITQTAYWNLTTYTEPVRLVLETTEMVAEVTQ